MSKVEAPPALNRLNQLPGLGYVSRKVDNLVEELGPYGAIQRMIKENGTRIDVYGLTPEIIKITKNKANVTIFNHRHQIEPLAIMYCLPPREDVSFVVAQSLLGTGENIAEYLIPVYYNEINQSGEKDKRFFKIPTSLTNRFCPVLTDTQKARINFENIKKTADTVKNKGMVYITPEGSLGSESKWYPGLGYLLKEIGADTDAYLISAYVTGTSNLDILRALPKTGKFLPTIKVFFANPKNLSEILFDGHLSAKQITDNEQLNYKNWVAALSYCFSLSTCNL